MVRAVRAVRAGPDHVRVVARRPRDEIPDLRSGKGLVQGYQRHQRLNSSFLFLFLFLIMILLLLLLLLIIIIIIIIIVEIKRDDHDQLLQHRL